MKSWAFTIRGISTSCIIFGFTISCGTEQPSGMTGTAPTETSSGDANATISSSQPITSSASGAANPQDFGVTAYSLNTEGKPGQLYFVRGFIDPSDGLVITTQLPVVQDGVLVTQLNTSVPAVGAALLTTPGASGNKNECQTREQDSIDSSTCSITFAHVQFQSDPNGEVQFSHIDGSYIFEDELFGKVSGNFTARTPVLSETQPVNFSLWSDPSCSSSSNFSD